MVRNLLIISFILVVSSLLNTIYLVVDVSSEDGLNGFVCSYQPIVVNSGFLGMDGYDFRCKSGHLSFEPGTTIMSAKKATIRMCKIDNMAFLGKISDHHEMIEECKYRCTIDLTCIEADYSDRIPNPFLSD